MFYTCQRLRLGRARKRNLQYKITTTCEGCKQTRTYCDTKALPVNQSSYCTVCKSVRLHITRSVAQQEPQKDIKPVSNRSQPAPYRPQMRSPAERVESDTRTANASRPARAMPVHMAPPPAPPPRRTEIAPKPTSPAPVATIMGTNTGGKKSIVTCGLMAPYAGWCHDAQRLCQTVCPEIPFTAYIDHAPPGSKSHDESPYGFKVHALLEENRKGFTQILWLDSAIELRHHPDLIFTEASQKGIFVCGTGHNLADSDGAGRRGEQRIAEWHGYREMPPFQIVSTRVICFDLENPVGLVVFNEWVAAEHAGQFKAKWPGDEQNLSYSLFKRGIPLSSYAEYALPDPLWWHKTLARI